jgi:hypothetical protein
MIATKLKKFFLELLKLMLALLAMVGTVYFIAILFLNIYISPTTLISSSISPDRSVKAEFLIQKVGTTWVDLITQDGYWSRKTKIYSVEASEVKFPKDLKVFWSEDSSTFLAISRENKLIAPVFRENTKLSSGYNLILMYNLINEKLSHNLFFPQTDIKLHVDDIKQIKWHNCQICK